MNIGNYQYYVFYDYHSLFKSEKARPSIACLLCVRMNCKAMAEKWCVTDISMDTEELEWSIENFLSFSKDSIESSIFTINGVQWHANHS